MPWLIANTRSISSPSLVCKETSPRLQLMFLLIVNDHVLLRPQEQQSSPVQCALSACLAGQTWCMTCKAGWIPTNHAFCRTIMMQCAHYCLCFGGYKTARGKSIWRKCPNVSTTPLRQWGFWQFLPFSWTTLRDKHCRHSIVVMGVVDTFGLCP